MRRRTEVVSFRAPEDLLRQIDAARQPFELSRGDWTRSAVTVHLHQSDPQLLLDELAEVREQVAHLTESMARLERTLGKATFLLLTNGCLDADTAKELVRRNLSPGEPRS